MDNNDELIGTSLKDSINVPKVSIPSKINVDEIIQNNKWTIGFLLLGLLLLGIGIFSVKSFSLFKDETKVEVLGSTSAEASVNKEAGSEIIVEIAGEVGKPGVYTFAHGDRVGDLLTRAGGLGINADREYVTKNINLAQKLIDGSKVYIPIVGEKSNLSNSSNSSDKININTATVAELDTLWGVGEATAKKIINGRPYQKPEELLQRKIINSNVWETIKDKITTW